MENQIRRAVREALASSLEMNILLEDFKTQKNKFISQGYSEDVVDKYIEDFKEIRDKKFKEAKEKELPGLNVKPGNDRFDIDKYQTFKELEILVDYIAGQRKFGSANFEDIKVNGEPVFKNKDVEVFYADTPRACIQYKGNKPYSWCVSRADSSNMFYNYRLNQHEPAFYFVKRIEATKDEFSFWNIAMDVFSGKFKDKYHFFVIQVIKNTKIGDENSKSYIVTSAMNDGDKQMSWSEIIGFAPELRGLQKIFEPVPLKPEEREKVNKYQRGLSDQEFAALPYKEKEYYMAIYVKMNKPLTDNQFYELPEDLKNKYVGFGVGLTDGQLYSIKNNSKLIKRYNEITNRKWEEFFKSKDKKSFVFHDSEIKILLSTDALISKLDSDGIENLLKYNSNPDKLIDIMLSNQNFVSNIDSDGIYNLLKSSNPDVVLQKLGQKGINYISNLDSDGIENLLKYNSNPDKLIDIMLSNQNFVSNIDVNGIYNLLKHSSNPDIVLKRLGRKGINYISNLDFRDIDDVLDYSKNKDKLIDIMLSNQNFVSNLDSNKINILVQYSSNPFKLINHNEIDFISGLNSATIAYFLEFFSSYRDKLISQILSNENLISNIDEDVIYYLLHYSSNPDKLIDKLLSNKKFVSNLKTDFIPNLLYKSSNPDIVLQKIGQKGIDYISNLDSREIKNLLSSSSNPNKIKEILKKYGKIEESILRNKIREIIKETWKTK